MTQPIPASHVSLPTRPVQAVLAPPARRQAQGVEADVLDVLAPDDHTGDVLPSYAELASQPAIAPPPHYNPFKSAKQAFWHMAGVPGAVGLAAGALVEAGGMTGAVALYRASVAQAVKTCTQAMTQDSELCTWALETLVTNAADCTSLCQKHAASTIDSLGLESKVFADPIYRGLITGLVVLGTGGVALGAAAAASKLAAGYLRSKRPDIAAARANSNPEVIELGMV